MEEHSKRKYLKITFLGIKMAFNFSIRANFIYLKKPNGELKKVSSIKGLKIKFKHSNSKVIIHEPKVTFKNCILIIGENCTFEVGAKTKDTLVGIKNVVFDMPHKDAKIIIGDNLYFKGGKVTVLQDSSLTIGEDCLFSSGITINIGNDHPMYDLNNPNKERQRRHVDISNKVWIGMNATILKNAGIANNSIVGASSVVAKKFTEENVAIAGNPARIIKREIGWDK